MSPEQVASIIVAVTGLLGALAVVLHNIAELRKDLDGRLQQLLEARSGEARKEGELAGRDFASRKAPISEQN